MKEKLILLKAMLEKLDNDLELNLNDLRNLCRIFGFNQIDKDFTEQFIIYTGINE